jgi:hypothetical protein
MDPTNCSYLVLLALFIDSVVISLDTVFDTSLSRHVLGENEQVFSMAAPPPFFARDSDRVLVKIVFNGDGAVGKTVRLHFPRSRSVEK